MSTQNTALRITELDFGSIKENLKNYLRNQAEFTDFDFTGSGMSVLLDLLAYNTHYMAMNLNLVGNEIFLDTAQLRASILSHSKVLNYIPTSKLAPQARINIQVTPGDGESNTTSVITLPRYTRFLSNPVNGVAYNFVTLGANTTTKIDDSFNFSNVVIKQGEVVRNEFLVDSNNMKRRFIIPSADMDTTTLRVTIQESEANTVTSSYELAEDLTELTANSSVYFLEENSDKKGSYTIFFGDGIIGKALSNSNIVIVDYLETQGPLANKATKFNLLHDIDGYDDNVSIQTAESATGGALKESIEKIRYHAPRFYTTQNRAVTKNDYESLLLKDYPNIEAVSVWGGEENDPPVYGKIYISMKPVENYEITALEKQRIVDEIISNRSVLTVFPEIVDPDYTYLLLRVNVNYNSNLTSLNESELETLIRAAISDYKNNELKNYNSIFRKSLLQRYIDNSHSSIISSSVKVYAQKRFEPTLNQIKNYTIRYNVSLLKSGIIEKLYTYPEFTMRDNFNVIRTVLIEEVPNSFTGIDQINVTNAGQNYIETPLVTITGDGVGATAIANIVNGKLSNITITNKGINYTRATIAITDGGGSAGTGFPVLESKNGTLRIFYYKENGERVIINNSIGTIDYLEGKIILNSLNPITLISNSYYNNKTLTMNIQPEKDSIITKRNQIIDIDETDGSSIIINIIAE